LPNWPTGALIGLDLLIDIAELRVPVPVLPAFQGLSVALQAEALLMQQVSDRVGADPVPLLGQLEGQHPQRLGGPPQRRHRVTPHIGLHQRQQRRAQPRIKVGRTLAATAPAARPPQRLLPGFQLGDPTGHSPLPHPGRPGNSPDTTMPQRPGLRPSHQPALPLIQMREQRRELARQRVLDLHPNAHTTRT
jgi:hypothetical protein